jgi:hypothetical protein
MLKSNERENALQCANRDVTVNKTNESFVEGVLCDWSDYFGRSGHLLVEYYSRSLFRNRM